jgi:uncharacterized membrane protein
MVLFRKHLFTTSEKKQIVSAIAAAEMRTSGEIRVHIEPRCKGDILARAAQVFSKLEMHKTEKRNGVLIYLAYDDKRFAIIGDKGINDVVPADFWDITKEKMAVYFKQNQFQEGVVYGNNESAKHLAKYFPHNDGDKNELSNEISEG